MSRLLLIGNGFDLAHGLKTEYSDFMEFLYNRDFNFFQTFNQLYSDLNRVGFYLWEDEKREFIKYKRCLCRPFWKGLESNLQYMLFNNEQEAFNHDSTAYEDLLTNYEEIVNDPKQILPMDYENTMFSRENYTADCDVSYIVDCFNLYLQEWVQKTSANNHEAMIEKNLKLLDTSRKSSFLPDGFFRNDDMIINFNYSNTIEQFYGIDDIWHIHGEGKKSKPAIMGHTSAEINWLLNQDELTQYKAIAYDLTKELYKNIDLIWASYKNDLSSKLKDIDEVYVLGLSYSDVDYEYFEKIKDEIKKDTYWRFSYFNGGKDKGEETKKRAIEYAKELSIDKSRYETIESDKIYTEERLYTIDKP